MCRKVFEKQSWESSNYWPKKKYCSVSCSKKGKPSWNKGLPKTWISPGDFPKGHEPWNKGQGEYAKKLGFGKWMIGRKGEQSHVWKGDKVGYEALHQWVYRELGAPNKCTHCGKSSKYPQGMHWANKSNEYKRDLSDWIRLCAKCHKAYDKGKKQKRF